MEGEGGTVQLDASKLSSRQLNTRLRAFVASGVRRVRVLNPQGIHYLAAGLEGPLEILVDGSVGYFAGSLAENVEVIVGGNAGWFVGDNMTSGQVVVEGHGGNGVGQYLMGGRVVVRRDAGDRVGALMKRGEVIIGGSAGIMAGLYMMGGKNIVLGDLEERAGEMMIGGAIYVAGRVESLGRNAVLKEVSRDEACDINRLLELYGFDGDYSFQKIVPESRRPIYSGEEKHPPLFRGLQLYEVSVDSELCMGCGVCVEHCPRGVLKLVNGKAKPVNAHLCAGCEACVTFCPANAVKVVPVRNQLPDYRRDVALRAAIGHPPVRGGGGRVRGVSFDDLVFINAQISRPPIDYYREPCDTTVELGGRYAEKPLKLSAPIIIGAMSFGAISKEAKIAIARAASKLGIAVNTGEGGMLPEERAEAKMLIAQYASGRFGVTARYLRSADAVEIKIGQGAKPGQGGLLLGEKVNEEIAALRGIAPGTDAVSPARHMDIVGPEDLKMKVEQLGEVTYWEKPIFVKFAAGRVVDDVKIAAKAGADVVVVDGKPAGTGAAPDILIDHVGVPSVAAVVQADRALRELGVRDEVSPVVSGGIRTGSDVAKALALGADAVAISSAVLIAMGCRCCNLCYLGKCPYGIATQDPKLRKRLNIEEAARRVENYLRAVIEELKMIVALTGKTSASNLDREDLRALTLDASKALEVKMVGE